MDRTTLCPNAGSYFPHIGGQAVFIDLGQRGAIVAALKTGQTSQDRPDGSTNAAWIAPRAFGKKSTNEELPELTRMRGHRTLSSDNMPRLIWFPNPADPQTAHKFRPEDIQNTFGPTARLAVAIEITEDPILIDIDKKLPWYEKLKESRDNHSS